MIRERIQETHKGNFFVVAQSIASIGQRRVSSERFAYPAEYAPVIFSFFRIFQRLRVQTAAGAAVFYGRNQVICVRFSIHFNTQCLTAQSRGFWANSCRLQVECCCCSCWNWVRTPCRGNCSFHCCKFVLD